MTADNAQQLTEAQPTDNKALAFEMRRNEGLTAQEIAARLGIAVSTAKKYIGGVPAGVSGRPTAPAKAAPAKPAGEDAGAADDGRNTTAAAPAVYAGPAAQLNSAGRVLPMTAASYPEVIDGELLCLGACCELKPAARFAYTAAKGDGKGRYVECGACQTKRLAANAERKAAGQAPLPRPRATVTA